MKVNLGEVGTEQNNQLLIKSLDWMHLKGYSWCDPKHGILKIYQFSLIQFYLHSAFMDKDTLEKTDKDLD